MPGPARAAASRGERSSAAAAIHACTAAVDHVRIVREQHFEELSACADFGIGAEYAVPDVGAVVNQWLGGERLFAHEAMQMDQCGGSKRRLWLRIMPLRPG